MSWFKDIVDTISGKKRRERIENEQASSKVEKELMEFLGEIIKDWNSAIYAEKISTPGGGKVVYKMENGWNVSFQGNSLEVETDKYHVRYQMGYTLRIAYVSTFNRIIEIVNEGSVMMRSSGKSQKNNTVHPKRKLYDTLVANIALRRENLSKLSNSDPSRKSLEMELEVVVTKAEKLRKEHGF